MAANFGIHNNFQRNYGYSFSICTLRVDARIPGWQRDVSQVLSSIHGVNILKMIPDGIIEVSGTVHPNIILDEIWRRTGRQAEIVSLQHGNCSSYSYRPGYGGQGHHGRYQDCVDDDDDGFGFGIGRGMVHDEYVNSPCCNGRSLLSSPAAYGGYWNHLPSPSSSSYSSRPFGGLVESFMRSPSVSPRWFWH